MTDLLCRRTTRATAACCACATVVLGAVVLAGFAPLFGLVLEKQMLLVNGTVAFSEWEEPSSAVMARFFLFSVANPRGILNGEEKPELIEMGPYAFRIRRRWYFQSDASGGGLDDVVTTINMPMLASSYICRNDYWTKLMLSVALSSVGSKVFVRKTVRELLFEGYEDELGSLGEMFGQESDEGPPLDRFGWFYKRNGTTWADGVYNMYTGEEDGSLLGRIASWNHRTRTNFRGSANGFYPPWKVASAEALELFSHEACRTLLFRYKSEGSVSGVRVRVFKLDETTFANASVHPPNACFENNLPTGVQNSTTCKMSSPIFLSFPHFYLADPFYSAQFRDGSVAARKELHESRISLEPTLSIPLEVVIRMQINVRLDPDQDIPELGSLPPELYLPVFWFEAKALAKPDAISKVAGVISAPDAARMAGVVLVAMGILGLACTWIVDKWCRGNNGRQRGSSQMESSSFFYKP